MEEGFPPITFTDPGIQVWITLGIALLVILLVWAVILVTARYVAEIALMRMVEDYERNGEKASIRQGLRFGWSRSAWRMFLISLLLSLPVILVLLLIPVAGLVMFLVITQWNPFTSVVGIVGSVGLFFLALFLAIMLGALLILLRHFMWRACVLEGLGVRQAMRQGFELARRNWQSVGLLWVMMIGLRILWGLAVMLAGLALIPVMLVTLAVGVVAAALPAFLVGGIASLFLGGPWSWILGAIFGLPILLIVGLSPLIFWRGLEMTFDSAVWTLAYRELKLLEELEPAAETTEG